MAALVEWPLTLFRTLRDGVYEWCGHVPRERLERPGRFLNARPLGLQLRHNGSAAYVVYHRQFFDPATYEGLQGGGTAWFRIDDIARFNREVLPRLEAPIVVVTTQSDWSVPGDFPRECDQLIRSGKVRRWYAANCDAGTTDRDVFVPLPVGVDYAFKYSVQRFGPLRRGYYSVEAPPPAEQDACFERLAVSAPPLSQRQLLAYGDFALNNTSRNRRHGESRADIQSVLTRSGCVVFPSLQVPRDQLIEAYARHAFVISPHGRGLDCYRTWEALAAGCIPIVKKSPLDPLYAGLPVVILERWEDVTPANLARWLDQYGDRFDRTRLNQVLSLDYWLGEISRTATLSRSEPR